MIPMKKIFLVILIVAYGFPLFARENDLHGKVQLDTRTPLKGAHVWLYDLTDTVKHTVTQTDPNGEFHFLNVVKGSYRVEINSVGYKKIRKMITVEDPNADLGTFLMTESPIEMQGMTIQERAQAAVQKGDTTEYNANAFKTNPDANVEDLVTKLPGVTVDNSGTVQSGGETVRRVLVDGKPFFGDDPTIAMRNLPAEVVDKVQVFDQASDQAQFTGFDDGQYLRTMNIITRRRDAPKEFGKLTAGGGDEGRYNLGGNMNFVRGNMLLSLIGSSNNINAQNFSMQDILGVISGNMQQRDFGRGGGRGGMRDGGGPRGGMFGSGGGMFGPGGGNPSPNFLIGQQQGLSTIHSLGGNFTDTVQQGFFLHANYFYNQTRTTNAQSLNRQYLLTGDSSSLYDQQTGISSKNSNHRVNARVDYAFDASNSIMVSPQLLFQDNRTSNILDAVNSLPSGVPLSQSQQNSGTRTTGNSLSGHILLRHKFDTPGRTISLDIDISQSLRNTGSDLTARNIFSDYSGGADYLLDEQSNGTSKSTTITPNLVYTEPLGLNSQLEINYQQTISKSTADKRAYDFDTTTAGYTIFNQMLSNTYENRYTAQTGGAAYRYSDRLNNFTVGISYQKADLRNNQEFPLSSSVSRSFKSILPNAMVNMRFEDGRNLRIQYQAATRAPLITQLQNVVDNSNPLLLTAGNPGLKQSYTHIITSRYSLAAPQEGRSMFIFLSGNYALDYIGNASIIPNRDTVVYGTNVQPGAQLTLPQNFDGYWSIRSFLTYGFPFDLINSTINLNSGVNYTRIPGSVNNEINISNAFSVTLGAVIGSNISSDLDFTLTYMGNYNVSRNTLQSDLNTNYYSHMAGLRFNWIIWEGITFRDDITEVLDNGRGTGYNQNSFLWNMSIAKKIFANGAGEIRLSVNDLLEQNKSLIRTITSSYVEDSRNEVLTRYLMLTFIYTVR
jgi:hypothetical protein